MLVQLLLGDGNSVGSIASTCRASGLPNVPSPVNDHEFYGIFAIASTWTPIGRYSLLVFFCVVARVVIGSLVPRLLLFVLLLGSGGDVNIGFVFLSAIYLIGNYVCKVGKK